MSNSNPENDGPPRSPAERDRIGGQTAEEGANYDAELRDWAFHQYGHSTVAFGRVFNDRKRSWPDGFAISTSPVLKGDCYEGSVITTHNTRYLLSGPPGDLQAMLQLAQQRAAKAARWTSVAEDERLFDLLQAAWGMDDATFERVAGLPQRWLWQWRNHYRAPSNAELARVRRLASFHDAIRLVTYGEPDYAGWWRRSWRADSFIGDRSPLDAVLQDSTMLDSLERYCRAQM